MLATLNPTGTTLNPNTVIDPQTPTVRAKDWNAPGATNLKYMNDAQFAEFQKMHPTAVMRERCYIGQDPDINIRTQMYQPPGRSSSPCYGGG